MVHPVLRNRKIQLILRYLIDFAKRNPIHCLSYLAKTEIHWTEFLYWIIFLSLMTFHGFISGILLLNEYRSRNSAITSNIDYVHFETMYPSRTICPHNILDPQKVEAYISYFKGNIEKEELKSFLHTLANITAKNAYYMDPGSAINQIPADDYMQLIFNLSYNYDITVEGKPTVKIMTEVGICYTFGNFLSKMYTKNWNDLWPFPAKFLDRFIDDSKWFNFAKQYPLEVQVKHNIIGNMTIYTHSPYEIPTTWSRPAAIINENESIKLNTVIKQLRYDKMLITETSIEERLCRTITESNLKMFPSMYSRNLCIMECRANYIEKLCKCVPHFYHNRYWNGVSVCDIEGLNCFARHIESFRTINANRNSKIFKCSHCYPNCYEQVVLEKITNNTRKHRRNSYSILFGIEYPPLEAYERGVMYTKLDYIVTLSSGLSAFLGFCIYSLWDCLYFFTVRIYWFRKGYRGSVDENYSN